MQTECYLQNKKANACSLFPVSLDNAEPWTYLVFTSCWRWSLREVNGPLIIFCADRDVPKNWIVRHFFRFRKSWFTDSREETVINLFNLMLTYFHLFGTRGNGRYCDGPSTTNFGSVKNLIGHSQKTKNSTITGSRNAHLKTAFMQHMFRIIQPALLFYTRTYVDINLWRLRASWMTLSDVHIYKSD